MKRIVLTLAVTVALFLTSCKESTHEKSDTTIIENTEATTTTESTVTSLLDKDGRKLEIHYDNTNGMATVTFDGETIEMKQEKAASGVWFKNDSYELRGKGNDLTLEKDGKVVFEHKDDIVKNRLKNKAGQTLDMTFNNTTNTVKVYLDGGEQIELSGERAASGIWYTNDHYELRGKGDNLTLKKDGKEIFVN